MHRNIWFPLLGLFKALTLTCLSTLVQANDQIKDASIRSITPCKHLVAIPERYSAPDLDRVAHGTLEEPIWDGDMAKTYPFQLDTFQLTAIACIVSYLFSLASACGASLRV